MIRVRDLKVWFAQRKGLVREILSRDSRWVRAVDGVSFDIRKGEIFCLVGESGCGKTTTGKALLQLVPTTEGDVFLEMPDRAYRVYESLKARAGDPDAETRKDALRRRYSTTWKENLPWTASQRLLVAGQLAAAAYVAFIVIGMLTGVVDNPWPSTAFMLAYGIGVGAVLGIVGALPPARVWKRTPAILALLGFFLPILVPLLSRYAREFFESQIVPAQALVDMLGVGWQDIFGMILAITFSVITAYAVSAVVQRWRQDVEGTSGIRMRTLRRRLHLIFQDPYESLNPKQSIYEIVSEPLRVNHLVSNPEELAALVSHALSDAGLRPPEDFMFRFPHEVSGGQRQRVSIAAALVLQPDFIVADEPVSMLDVSIRTDILKLMLELRRSKGLTYLFITHDLSLAWVIADRIGVMYLGKIVELGTTAQIIRSAKHPYTQALISVVPSPDPRHKATRTILRGERPDPVNIPTGCRFHPRCPLAFERCGWNAAEMADELAEAEGEIVARTEAALREKRGEAHPTVAGLQVTPAPDAADALPLASDEKELEDARDRALLLKRLFKPEEKNPAVAAVAQDDRTLVVPAPPGMTAAELGETLRGLTQAQRARHLAFKAIDAIETLADTVVLRLHEWSEPELLEIAPGNLVACHLATPAAPRVPVVAAVPAD